jgi:hypothetical protein
MLPALKTSKKKIDINMISVFSFWSRLNQQGMLGQDGPRGIQNAADATDQLAEDFGRCETYIVAKRSRMWRANGPL